FFGDRSESLSLRLLGGYLLKREDIAANGTVTDLLGVYLRPELTANITTNYGVGPWSFQLQGRYIAGDKLVRTWTEGIDVDDNSVASSTWWNGTVRYRGELRSGAEWNIGLAILNLFDTNPPIVPFGT